MSFPIRCFGLFFQIPVMLALIKLAIIYGLRYLSVGLGQDSDSGPTEEPLSAGVLVMLQRLLGPDWDLYMMGIFAAVFLGLAILRWPR